MKKLNLLLEEYLDAEKDKIVVFMAGGVGVGKSTFSQIIFGDTFEDFISIRPDALLERAERMKGSFDPDTRKEVVKRSKESAMRMFGKRTSEHYNVILDRTAADPVKTLADKKKLEDAGYTCYMIFVYVTDPKIALERNASRKRKEPEDVVLEYAAKARENAGVYRNIFGTRFIPIRSNVRLRDLTPAEKTELANIGSDIKNAILNKDGILKFRKRTDAILR